MREKESGGSRMGRFNLHVFIRWSAVAGILVLFIRRTLYLRYPNFLPSRSWHPESASARWIGMAMNGITEFVILCVLLGLPFCFYLMIRFRLARLWSRPVALDVAFCVVAYLSAYFFLSPPKGSLSP